MIVDIDVAYRDHVEKVTICKSFKANFSTNFKTEMFNSLLFQLRAVLHET